MVIAVVIIVVAIAVVIIVVIVVVIAVVSIIDIVVIVVAHSCPLRGTEAQGRFAGDSSSRGIREDEVVFPAWLSGRLDADDGNEQLRPQVLKSTRFIKSSQYTSRAAT